MGLFDTIRRRVIREITGPIIDNAIDSAFDNLINGGKNTQNGQQNTYQNTPAAPVYNEDGLYNYNGTAESYFSNIFYENFPEYFIETNVSAKRFDAEAHPACKPISFLFSQNGAPVLAVVLVKGNTYRGMNVIGTKWICEDNRIPYLRFFTDRENLKSYVIERTRNHLK